MQDEYWEQMVNIVNSIRDVLNDKPTHLKFGYYPSSVGSILNAYREGDLSFVEAINLLQVKETKNAPLLQEAPCKENQTTEASAPAETFKA